MFRREKRKVPGLNTSSTADISFMLLILFLVTTSMDADKGVSVQLPAIEKTQDEQPSMVDVGKILNFKITADNKILLNGKNVELSTIKSTVSQFVTEKGKEHIIQMESDRKASYDTYFNLQNEIIAGYQILRNKRSEELYGKSYAQCSIEQQSEINKEVPQRISETYDSQAPVGEGGGE
ncbi:biopolymer transporter ExbD [Prevotella sp. HUN102]|uniref:ExbD/TolR family protein n=1 Tax=Prevotella sp. HUN102 TaxID=1392486 RepID=UPI00048CCA9A|nr:biopolymer transporter ExbD [Prevotella sp. HUN102]